MDAGLRNWAIAIFGVLALTGYAWLTLHFGFAVPGEFGVAPHPAEAPLLTVHGIAALLATFLFGWIASAHIAVNWTPRRRRTSGLWLASLIAALALTGLANYYVTAGPWHDRTAVAHEVAGVVILLPALIHWFKRERKPA